MPARLAPVKAEYPAAMNGWVRVLLGGLLLCAVAAAGIGLNFTLLRLAGDDNDPAGKLSPRAVFLERTTATPPTTATTPPTTATTPPTTTQPVVTDDDSHGSNDEHAGDDDNDD
jgi:hypothetical protein